ncbi:1,2-phenylacetyl-CoA epoxidase subunit PaaD [Streptomyces xiamenensis]|uniref:1,2-phenylacetyl-CoA epoxidase subunit PaaD n=1 Tax=Streptomyces xiamenensis TaxID=408015 RepID=UPI000AEC5CE7
MSGAQRPTAAGTAPGVVSERERELYAVAGAVPDPELPVLTLAELGVLRAVRLPAPGRAEVELTPTYTGCPAVETMAADIGTALRAAGVAEVVVRTVLTPPWSTADITDSGRRKLRAAGIAPPRGGGGAGAGTPLTLAIHCPRCDAVDTPLISRFSGTACMELRRCAQCAEPFDHMKEI